MCGCSRSARLSKTWRRQCLCLKAQEESLLQSWRPGTQIISSYAAHASITLYEGAQMCNRFCIIFCSVTSKFTDLCAIRQTLHNRLLTLCPSHSIFRRPYFLTRFLPALLTARVVCTLISLLFLPCLIYTFTDHLDYLTLSFTIFPSSHQMLTFYVHLSVNHSFR